MGQRRKPWRFQGQQLLSYQRGASLRRCWRTWAWSFRSAAPGTIGAWPTCRPLPREGEWSSLWERCWQNKSLGLVGWKLQGSCRQDFHGFPRLSNGRCWFSLGCPSWSAWTGTPPSTRAARLAEWLGLLTWPGPDSGDCPWSSSIPPQLRKSNSTDWRDEIIQFPFWSVEREQMAWKEK